MTLLKNLMLSGTAALAVCSGAQAADLPMAKSAPVEYVRICDAFGAGFFYIPGTDTCLRVNGAVRAEYTVRGGAPTDNLNAFARNQAGTTFARDYGVFRARGYLNADARTQTAYGTIRTYVSYRLTTQSTQSGPFGGGSVTPAGASFSQKTSLFQGNPNPQAVLDKGFIQFAGITAGRAQSFFDFDAQSHELLTNTFGNSNLPTEMFAYTASFANGFSATLSVENQNERDIGDNGSVIANISPTATKAGYLAYAGDTIPDFVGSLRVDQAWGSAQLAGAYHLVSSQTVSLPGGALVSPKDKDGFAGLAGVKLLVPQLAKGDNFVVQGTYESGAMSYINTINYDNGFTNVFQKDVSISLPVNDAFIAPGGTIQLQHAYAVYAAFQHYWTPEWNSTIFGDYGNITNPHAAQLLSIGNDNAELYQIGGNLIWTPVKDLIIGGEVLYTNMKLTGAGTGTSKLANGTSIPTPTNPDDIRARFSIRRAF